MSPQSTCAMAAFAKEMRESEKSWPTRMKLTLPRFKQSMRPTILDVVCRTTGLSFAAVARVTEDRWVACTVLDNIDFGLVPGGGLKVETTICNEIRQTHEAVIIDHVDDDEVFCGHPTPAMYGFQSYISMPIIRKDGSFFGTLCTIDPLPHRLKNAGTIGMFRLFAELIALHLDASDRLKASQQALANPRPWAHCVNSLLPCSVTTFAIRWPR